MKAKYSIGIDFGTGSVRSVIIDLYSGEQIATASNGFQHGIITSEGNPHLARQNPIDYLQSMEMVLKDSIQQMKNKGFNTGAIVGIGVDATASTPIPVSSEIKPLCFYDEFKDNVDALAWLWKDHSSEKEAEEITTLANEIRPEYLKQCGGKYSSEWFFSKILHCNRHNKKVFNAAYTWIEQSDYIPAVLCGIKDNASLKRNTCAAGHKALFNTRWGGLPDQEFLNLLSPELGDLRKRLYSEAFTYEIPAGFLSEEWAQKIGIAPGIPVAMGMIDAHQGAVGAGVQKNTLAKVIGTSTCDLMVFPKAEELSYIPGVAGIVEDSVLPGYTSIEAGQAAVGDLLEWYVGKVLQKEDGYHKILTEKASAMKAGQSGLLALDWNNGNRNVLGDANLTGLLVGQTLLTDDYEIYRALIEATAFGALKIAERIESFGVKIEKVVTCGGITHKNPMFMQIYADVFGKPMFVAENEETVALGAAISGAFVALKGQEDFKTIEEIQARLCRNKKTYYPDINEHKKYKELYNLYLMLHDAFGVEEASINLSFLMKRLLELKN